ncbi:MAG: NRDE family protein [Rubrobacter sp.]|nr:NRDE family protein [Rubrobacter sp.]
MCLILFANEANSRYRLSSQPRRVLLPSNGTCYFWKEVPEVLAGKDLKSGGSWMGVTRSDKVAAITNFRGPGKVRENVLSRGNLVSDFLMSSESPDVFIDKLRSQARKYNGFNLLLGTAEELCGATTSTIGHCAESAQAFTASATPSSIPLGQGGAW